MARRLSNGRKRLPRVSAIVDTPQRAMDDGRVGHCGRRRGRPRRSATPRRRSPDGSGRDPDDKDQDLTRSKRLADALGPTCRTGREHPPSAGLRSSSVRHLSRPPGRRYPTTTSSAAVSDPLSSGSVVPREDGSAATRWLRRALGCFRDDDDASLSHSVLDAVPDAVVVVDAEGLILTANRAARETLGHAPGALVGSGFAETVLAWNSRVAFRSRLRSTTEAA